MSSETLAYYFFGVLLSFAALLMAAFFVAVLRKRAAVGAWSPAHATVVESAAVWGITGSGGRTAGTWLPRFTYQYEVGGRLYTGKRIAFYRRCTGSRAQALVARHPVGSRVQVFYDPARPEESVLERDLRGSWVLLASALAFGILAAVFFKLPTLLAR